jgi:Ner family transcriptional regulator
MSISTAQKKPVIQDWHPADVVAALRKKGWSLQQLALHHGYAGRTSLSSALAAPYPKAEAIVAEALGVAPQEIWPSRYNADGTPNRKRGSKPMRPDHIRNMDKATTPVRAGNLQNGRTR